MAKKGSSTYWKRVKDTGYDVERTFDIFRSEESFQASDYKDFDEFAAEIDKRFNTNSSFSTFGNDGREAMKDKAEEWFNDEKWVEERSAEEEEEEGEEVKVALEGGAAPSGEVFEPMTPEQRDQLHRDVDEIIERHEREGRSVTPEGAIVEAIEEAEAKVSVSGVEPEGGQIIGGAEAVQPVVVEGAAAVPGEGIEQAIAAAEEKVEQSAAGGEGPSISIVDSAQAERKRRGRKLGGKEPSGVRPSGGYVPGDFITRPPQVPSVSPETPSVRLPPGEQIVRNISGVEEHVGAVTGTSGRGEAVEAPSITIVDRIYNVGASVRSNIVDITSRVVGFINSLRGR